MRCGIFYFFTVYFSYFRDTLLITQHWGLFAIVVAMLPFIAGVIGGAQYPLAIDLAQKKSSEGAVAGKFYSLDVFGASLGSLLSGILFIPLFGIEVVVQFCAILNFLIVILLVINRRM